MCISPPWVGMQATIATISACQQERGITEVSLLNFVVSDGVNMIATRYVSHESESAASLYYAEGSAFQRETPNAGHRPDSATPAAASNAASARDTAVTGMVLLFCLANQHQFAKLAQHVHMLSQRLQSTLSLMLHTGLQCLGLLSQVKQS